MLLLSNLLSLCALTWICYFIILLIHIQFLFQMFFLFLSMFESFLTSLRSGDSWICSIFISYIGCFLFLLLWFFITLTTMSNMATYMSVDSVRFIGLLNSLLMFQMALLANLISLEFWFVINIGIAFPNWFVLDVISANF